MQLVSLRTRFVNYFKRANEARFGFMIFLKINMMHTQQDRIANSKIHSTMPMIVPLRLMLLCMPKGYLCLLNLLDYIAYILLSTFVWMHTPQYIHYSLNILTTN